MEVILRTLCGCSRVLECCGHGKPPAEIVVGLWSRDFRYSDHPGSPIPPEWGLVRRFRPDDWWPYLYKEVQENQPDPGSAGLGTFHFKDHEIGPVTVQAKLDALLDALGKWDRIKEVQESGPVPKPTLYFQRSKIGLETAQRLWTAIGEWHHADTQVGKIIEEIVG